MPWETSLKWRTMKWLWMDTMSPFLATLYFHKRIIISQKISSHYRFFASRFFFAFWMRKYSLVGQYIDDTFHFKTKAGVYKGIVVHAIWHSQPALLWISANSKRQTTLSSVLKGFNIRALDSSTHTQHHTSAFSLVAALCFASFIVPPPPGCVLIC